MKKTQPPIYTTDGAIINDGMTLYCFDDCANPLKVQVLKVLSVDRGRSRSVRLLRKNKREWTWSSVDRQSSCRSQNHFLYATRKAATEAIAVASHKREVKGLESQLKEERRKVSNCRSYVSRAKQSVAANLKDLKSAEKAVKVTAQKLAELKAVN